MSDQQIEREIQAKGADVAPRVTPADIEAEIAAEYSFTADKAIAGCPVHPSMTLLTICVLVLKNGLAIIGEAACVSPANFNADIGRQVARQNAVAKIWPLLGFRLRDQLSAVVITEADAAADLAGTPRPT